MAKIYLLLVVVAFILVVLIAPFVFVIRSIFTKDKSNYYRSVALGLDQVGGSVLYAKEDWTVSSWTHYLCVKTCGWHCKFRAFIDKLFGEGHCKNAFQKEAKELSFNQE